MANDSAGEDRRRYTEDMLTAGGKSRRKAMAKLESLGKNDSVKSAYSLSVFIDPDASKDMVRQEELWYTMYESDGNRGARRSTQMVESQSSRLAELEATAEATRQEEQSSRRGSVPGTSNNSKVVSRTGSDAENFFNKNTMVVGVEDTSVTQYGEDGVGEGRGMREGRGKGYAGGRANGEEVTMLQEREERAPGELLAEGMPMGDETITVDLDDTEEVVYATSVQETYTEGGQPYARSKSSEANGDHEGIRMRSETTGRYTMSDSATDDDADYHRNRVNRVPSAQASDTSGSAANDPMIAALRSGIQERQGAGYVRNRSTASSTGKPLRTAAQPEYDSSMNIGSRTRSSANTIGSRYGQDNGESSAMAEGGNEDALANQRRQREPIQRRSQMSRTKPIDTSVLDNYYHDSQSSGASRDSMNRKSSSAITSAEDRTRTRRTSSPGDDEGPLTPVQELGSSTYVRAASYDMTTSEEDDGRLNSRDSREDVQVNQVPAPRAAYRSEPGIPRLQSSDEEVVENDNVGRIRQPTPLIQLTRPSTSSMDAGNMQSSQRMTAQEEVDRSDAQLPTPDSGSRRLEQREAHDRNGFRHHRTRPDKYQNSTSTEDGDIRRPRPAQRKRVGVSDSVSSFEPSSSNEASSSAVRPPIEPVEREPARNTHTTGNQFVSDDEESSSLSQSMRRNARQTVAMRGTDSSDDYPGNARLLPQPRRPGREVDKSSGSSPRLSAPQPQSRKHVRQNKNRAGDYSDSSTSQGHRGSQPRRHDARPVHVYDDDDDDDDDTETDDTLTNHGKKVVVDFGSESDDFDSGYRKTTTTRTVTRTKSPVAGFIKLHDDLSPASSRLNVRETRVVTTPVTGLVSVNQTEPSTQRVSTESYATPMVGLISVHRSPSPERAKTPVAGIITSHERDISQHSVTRTKTPMLGIITPHERQNTSTQRISKTPIEGLISVNNGPVSHRSTSRLSTAVEGLVSVNGGLPTHRPRSAMGRTSTVITDPAFGLYRGGRSELVNTVVESVPFDIGGEGAEIVGVDPELRRAQKTGANYRITMNLRPVVGDPSEVGYDPYSMGTMPATPIPALRRTNGRTPDARFFDDVGSRYSTMQSASTRSWRGGARTPNGQFASHVDTFARRFGQQAPRPYSVYDQYSTLDKREVGHGDFMPGRLISRSSSMTDGDVRRHTQSHRRSEWVSPPGTLLTVPPILQTVTSRPHPTRSVNDIGYGQYGRGGLRGFGAGAGGGRGATRPTQRLSSSMSSVFMSPTMERRVNRRVTNQPLFVR